MWWGSNSREKGCCALNVSSVLRPVCWNTWLPVGGIVQGQEPLGGRTLLEHLSHSGVGAGLRLSMEASLPLHPLLPECECNVTSKFLVPAAMSFPTMMGNFPLGLSQNEPFSP